MKDGLCQLKSLETLQFLATGAAASTEQHRSPLEIPPRGDKEQQQDKAIWGHILVIPASPRALLPALSSWDSWELLVQCSGQRKGLLAVRAQRLAPGQGKIS